MAAGAFWCQWVCSRDHTTMRPHKHDHRSTRCCKCANLNGMHPSTAGFSVGFKAKAPLAPNLARPTDATRAGERDFLATFTAWGRACGGAAGARGGGGGAAAAGGSPRGGTGAGAGPRAAVAGAGRGAGRPTAAAGVCRPAPSPLSTAAPYPCVMRPLEPGLIPYAVSMRSPGVSTRLARLGRRRRPSI